VELQLQEFDTVVCMTPIRRRAMVLIALPALIILTGCRTLPESPRWLLSRGPTSEAAAMCMVLALAACGVMLGVYALTGQKFEPRGRDLYQLAPATSAADAT